MLDAVDVFITPLRDVAPVECNTDLVGTTGSRTQRCYRLASTTNQPQLPNRVSSNRYSYRFHRLDTSEYCWPLRMQNVGIMSKTSAKSTLHVHV